MSKVSGIYLKDVFWQEVPTGAVNGSNTDFELSSAPAYPRSVNVYLNGLLQRFTVDFTVSSTTITFTTAPSNGQQVYATFVKGRE